MSKAKKIQGYSAQVFLLNVSQLAEKEKIKFEKAYKHEFKTATHEQIEAWREMCTISEKICDEFVRKASIFKESGISVEKIEEIFDNAVRAQQSFVDEQMKKVTAEETIEKTFHSIKRILFQEIINEFESAKSAKPIPQYLVRIETNLPNVVGKEIDWQRILGTKNSIGRG